MRSRYCLFALVCVVSMLALPGCSVRSLALGALTGALSGGGGGSLVFTAESDPEIVTQSLPTMLKVYEALVEAEPDNQALLSATGKAFALYAYACVQVPADRMCAPGQAEEQKEQYRRAKMFYFRARDYLLRSLELRYPGFTDALIKGTVDSALAMSCQTDSAELYWIGVSWMGGLTVGKPGLSAVFHLKRTAALLHKVLAYNEGFDGGAAHETLVAYYGLLPESMGGDTARAREHFQRAVELSGGTHARAYVIMASTVALKRGDRDQFTTLLNAALGIDTKERSPGRLTNVIAQQTARWLLSRMDELLPVEP